MEERHLNGTMFNPMCEVFPKGDKITEAKNYLAVQISQLITALLFSSWQLLFPTLQQGRSVKTDDFDDAIMMMKMKRVIMMTVVKRSNRWPTVSQCSLYSWSQHDQ